MAPLDQGIELAAYRIVQEALTNARRHAPGAAVDVELAVPAGPAAWSGSATTGPARAPRRRHGGHGLAGMRERAAMAGGTLWTGAGGPSAASSSRPILPIGGGGRVTDHAVVVVDDQEVVRAAFGALLATQPDFAVVGTAADGAQAVRLCRGAAPGRGPDGRAHAR